MTILAATDLSTRSASALRFAESMASALDTSLTIVHVAPDTRPDIAKDASNALEMFTREHLDRPESHTHQVVVGETIAALTAEAGEHELLVCGATGSSLVDDIFLGSTASRLLRESPTPVCVVPPAIDGEPTTIVVPIAFDRASRAGLQLAAKLSGATGADICLLHALDIQMPSYAAPPTDEDIDRLTAEARERLRQWAEEEGVEDVLTSVEVSRKEPAESIRQAVADHDADLVVMGTHGRGTQTLFFLGSVAERVVRQPPCAVITTRPTQPDQQYSRQG